MFTTQLFTFTCSTFTSWLVLQWSPNHLRGRGKSSGLTMTYAAVDYGKQSSNTMAGYPVLSFGQQLKSKTDHLIQKPLISKLITTED